MKTIQTKPTTYPNRKSFVGLTIKNGGLWVYSKPFQNHLKNIITSPE
ncbi:MAG: hypothetical protein QHC79_04225 [Pseudosphingobacterium sp.]|nr:hypothetical protein [Olivibacter sp. UJ_SKK_5.1]MDX3912721.1 hypothetical protein [Pseudosphingobacterium sp.]